MKSKKPFRQRTQCFPKLQRSRHGRETVCTLNKRAYGCLCDDLICNPRLFKIARRRKSCALGLRATDAIPRVTHSQSCAPQHDKLTRLAGSPPASLQLPQSPTRLEQLAACALRCTLATNSANGRLVDASNLSRDPTLGASALLRLRLRYLHCRVFDFFQFSHSKHPFLRPAGVVDWTIRAGAVAP